MLYNIVQLIRIRQWVKNLFIFVPFIFTPAVHKDFDIGYFLSAFFVFCCVSSMIYVLNDYIDVDKDKLHPKKSLRPIASGAISKSVAILLMGFLICTALLLSYILPVNFLYIVMLYIGINITYCFYIKNFSIIDVMSIASGFVLRVYAGAVLIEVTPSIWILLCTGFLALFMAFAKRRDDIVHHVSGKHRLSLSGYNQQFLDIACTVCLTALLIFYALYTNDVNVQKTLGTKYLYVTLPSVILGVFRYMQITFVEKKSGDPTYILTTDKIIVFSIITWIMIVFYLIF